MHDYARTRTDARTGSADSWDSLKVEGHITVHVQSPAPIPPKTAVLLVDHDPVVRRSVQLLLRSAGYDVRAYAAGPNLLANLRPRESACLITAFGMPDVDGAQLLQLMRSKGWAGRAILLTKSPTEMKVQGSEAGFCAVLAKPPADRVLLDAVRAATRIEWDQPPVEVLLN